jgi:hypothetical protein
MLIFEKDSTARPEVGLPVDMAGSERGENQHLLDLRP